MVQGHAMDGGLWDLADFHNVDAGEGVAGCGTQNFQLILVYVHGQLVPWMDILYFVQANSQLL